jgi:uncharacterized protein
VWDAVFLLIGLHFAEGLVALVLHDFRSALGLSDEAREAMTLLLASAIVFTLAMRFTRTRYAKLFHASPVPPATTAATLLLPVVGLVPVLVLLDTLVMDGLVAVVPLAGWEEELFARFAEGTLPGILMICVLAPVIEEMLFRGLILRGFLARYPRWPAIVVSALLFGASHLNLYQFVLASFSGIVLGWLYERTRSLIPCIALHAAYNGAVTWLNVQPDAWDEFRWDGSVAAWSFALGAALLSVAALRRMLPPARA